MAIALLNTPAAAQNSCGPRDTVAKLLGNEYDESTVAVGLASSLGVSVDGSTQETYERYRRRGSLEKVLGNIRLLVDERRRQRSRKPFISLCMLINKYNEHQIEEMREIAKDLGMSVTDREAEIFLDNINATCAAYDLIDRGSPDCHGPLPSKGRRSGRRKVGS